MKRIINITIIFCALATGNVLAQSIGDALLFSQYYAGGTARSIGMSGAFGALGGDLSVLSTNPAGLAIYRGSEFTFTPGLNFSSTNALFQGTTYNEKYTKFVINNIGYVYTKNLYREKGLQSVNFGISYNRLSDFNSEGYVRWQKANSSLLDEFVWDANDGFIDDFYNGLAMDTHAIFDDGSKYLSDYDDFGYDEPMYRTISTRGGIGEYDLSLGLNFNHKLFFGASLGIQDLYYETYFFHEETPRFTEMDSFNFTDQYTLNGWGLNFKMGLIYRPIQMLRLGASIQTPTRLWLKPFHLTTMDSWFNTPPTTASNDVYYWAETESDPAERSKITTPWRYSVSAAGVFGNFGLIDIDVEFVDYSTCNLLPNSDFEAENDYASNYKSAVNVKTGAEFRFGPMYVRGGMAYYGTPYNDGLDIFKNEVKNKSTLSYSGGIGFRFRSFYMDAAYSYTKFPKYFNDLYYIPEKIVTTSMQTTSNKVAVTFGFKF